MALETDCTLALRLFPGWGIGQHCKAWRRKHKRKVRKGLQIALPNPVQIFTVTGIMHFGPKAKPVMTDFHFTSHCALCGEPYAFKVPSRFTGLIRTCPAHRGQKPRADKRPLKPPSQRLGVVQAATLGELALAAQAGLPVATSDMVARIAARLEPAAPGKRDTRRQRIVRCIESMLADDTLPDGITLDGMQFVFAMGMESV